ncbi:MAG: urea carboxylase [Halioglobus sp.]
MFSRVLIANRGAIAVRIIRTLKALGITSVAVYADADRDSLHVEHADECYALGAGSAADTYLNQDKLIELMQTANIDAVHPGYGFLSENAEFCQRCEQAGIAFIGPTPEQMSLFGLKHTARTAAQESGVPLLPGTGLLLQEDEAEEAASAIGFPLILKSTAGGGGIGMQVCRSSGEIREAFASVRRLGSNNFSNDGVFIEKYVDRARHIEVQVFGDGRGNALALGERDCSAQRRNQKVIEEAPAPGLSSALRENLHRTAVMLMRDVSYRGAGTVEFILDADSEEFYFLEVNTRLQVEHGVTEQVYNVDLVAWMVRLAAGELESIEVLARDLQPTGHAIQARIYAENPGRNFQPCAGLLTAVSFPPPEEPALRIDHWLQPGVEISSLYDPMLAKVICHSNDRDQSIRHLASALGAITLEGIETNRAYCRAVLEDAEFQTGCIDTRYLDRFSWQPPTIDVLSPGTMTTVQDFPGRTGYWNIGVPPSGPFDDYSMRLGNRILGNPVEAAGLELTMNGPTLYFNSPTRIVLTGADMDAVLDDIPLEFWRPYDITAGQTLRIGRISGAGARAYLLVQGGLQCEPYLGSRSTFTLGRFGGHGGRALRTGDVLHLDESTPLAEAPEPLSLATLPSVVPQIGSDWSLRVIYGPHGAPDFFTEKDIDTFFSASWRVHYNSSRTGIRLIGPKPDWARSDGGEAGMHPSNIHDNAYAIGTIDFTGDMPVILGPDGPSLGGFVCPATVAAADLWKLGQLKAGDHVRFIPVSQSCAGELRQAQAHALTHLSRETVKVEPYRPNSPVLNRIDGGVPVTYRPSGDRYLLVEYGPLVLDIRLRFRVHALMAELRAREIPGVYELTPGIRSLQLHYDPTTISLDELLERLQQCELELQAKMAADDAQLEVPSRIVHLPLSWDDDACREAIEKYQESVRSSAPWCPSNIEFIRRINGLPDIAAVKQIVFDASYVVMGLGDVYLGAPVATPLDPRHRLVTTKYNPARTWTAENSVGIGGAFLCVYGMEGPGGYQLVGRTLQMWNRYRQTDAFDKPWLLRFFDQIRFYEVSSDELADIRRDFPVGRYPLRIEQTRFNLKEYETFLAQNSEEINHFTASREAAFDSELQRWIASGDINFSVEDSEPELTAEQAVDDGCSVVESPVTGSVWQLCVEPGQHIEAGQAVCLLESMKMEVEVTAIEGGVVRDILCPSGSQVQTGQAILVLDHRITEADTMAGRSNA